MSGTIHANSSITTTLTTAVTISIGAYPFPLVIEPTGAITPTANDVTALYSTIGGVTIYNFGTIHANGGFPVFNPVPAEEGIGVFLSGPSGSNFGTFNNDAVVIGAAGVHGRAGDLSPFGAGIYAQGPGYIVNGFYGTIIGGGGIPGSVGADGVLADGNGVTLATDGLISAGPNGAGAGAALGDAVVLSGPKAFLKLFPGARFIGAVVGDYISNDYLQLQSYTSKGTLLHGTLTGGIGVEYQDFAHVLLTQDAAWTITGYNSLQANGHMQLDPGATLTNAGTIAGGGNASAPIGIVLAGAGAIVANDGAITNPGIAIYGTLGAETILNAGTIETTGTNKIAIALRTGGSIDNSGLISGITAALSMFGAVGTVTNSGAILAGTAASYAVALNTGGEIANGFTGTIGVGTAAAYGVLLTGGGAVVNDGSISGGNRVVDVTGAPGTVINAGTISGGHVLGVQLAGGGTLINAGSIAGGYYASVVFGAGSVADRLILDQGARFTGSVLAHGTGGNVVELSPDFVLGTTNRLTTVYGLGTSLAGFNTLLVDASASWTLAAGGNFTGATTLDGFATLTNDTALTGTANGVDAASSFAVLTNAGTITGAAIGRDSGVAFQDGGAITNSGLILGSDYGVFIGGAQTGLITNSGTIAGGALGAGDAIDAADNVTITNGGVIFASSAAGYAISLTAGGLIANTGTIEGGGRAIGAGNSPATVQNSGVIKGGAVVAVALNAGGTLINAGTILGGSYGAVVFNDGAATDRLVIDPGASFSGQVLAHSTVSAVIELASGSNHGTIGNFGSYTGNFNSLVVDPGAHWELAGGSFTGGVSIGAGGYLSDLASLAVGTAGVTVASSATLFGLDTITAASNAGYAVVLQGGFVDIFRGVVSGGQRVIGAQGTSETIVNDGTIEGGNVLGIQLAGGGEVNNGGVITGGYYAAIVAHQNATISNGYIIAAPTATNAAILLAAGGEVTNAYAGSITGGQSAVRIAGGAGTVINQGVIAPEAGGGVGVYLGQGGTVIDGGTIGGTFAAVWFGDTAASDLLVVDQGARFNGQALSSNSLTSTLALGRGAGYLGGIGTSFVGFADISFATGVAWTAAGTYTAFDAGHTIAGFAKHDTLVLDGFAANPVNTTYVQGIGLELTSSTGGAITLDIAGSFSTGEFTVTDPAAVTTITVNPCFCAGTRILLGRGEVAVEALAVGDELVLADGGLAPIRWIGYRRIEIARHANPERVLPVVIEAGALADFVPQRALYLSPDHALYLGGCLIPAKALINGATIRQVERRVVDYYHVELERHAALFAEGVTCESYLESGNRGAFANGGAAIVLHPDFAQRLREAEGFAPLVESGPVVEAVRRRILARAQIATCAEPDVTIRHRADGAVVIASRSAIPGYLAADPRDRRRLGVKIGWVRIGGAVVALDHPGLVEGWHDPEPDGRWTGGNAVIPAALAGAGAVEVRIAATVAYPWRAA